MKTLFFTTIKPHKNGNRIPGLKGNPNIISIGKQTQNKLL